MGAVAPYAGMAFDYAILTDNVAAAAREAATRIKERVRGQQIAIFDIGRDLIATKEALGHGHFLTWIEVEFGMSDRTARSYMQVADVFGCKSEIVSDLPSTVLYALAAPSTPADVRDDVLGAIEAGQPPALDQIHDRIKAARTAAKEQRAEAKRTPSQRAYKRKVARTVEQEEQARRKRIAERDAAIADVLAILTDRFGDDLPAFAATLKKVDLWCFREALEKVAQG